MAVGAHTVQESYKGHTLVASAVRPSRSTWFAQLRYCKDGDEPNWQSVPMSSSIRYPAAHDALQAALTEGKKIVDRG